MLKTYSVHDIGTPTSFPSPVKPFLFRKTYRYVWGVHLGEAFTSPSCDKFICSAFLSRSTACFATFLIGNFYLLEVGVCDGRRVLYPMFSSEYVEKTVRTNLSRTNYFQRFWADMIHLRGRKRDL